MSTKKSKKIQRDFVFLTASMFVVITAWVGFSVYNAYVTSTIDETLQLTIQPITGTFDLQTLETLKSNTAIEPDYDNPLLSASGSADAATPVGAIQQAQAVTPTPDGQSTTP